MRVISTQKLPMVFAVCRAMPRTKTAAMAMPIAAERKL